MKPLHIALTAALMTGTGALAASAQQQTTLTGEVTVERSLTPTRRDASRLNMLPTVSLPALASPTLSYSRRAVTTPVAPAAGFVEPPMRADTLDASYRGYADLGVFPLFNVDLAAGYRILRLPSTSLDAWLQYDGTVYRAPLEGADHKSYWRDHSVSLGANAVHNLGSHGMLSGAVSYTFARVNGFAPSPYWVNSNRADVAASWVRHGDALSLKADVAYGYFGYNPIGVPAPDNRHGARDNRFTLSAGGTLPLDDYSHIGLDLGLDLLATGKHFASNLAGDFIACSSKTTGVVTLTPFYRFTYNNFEVSAGPRVEFTFNGGKAFHIAPEVKAGWTPTSMFGASLRLGGGEYFNSLASVADIVRRPLPFTAYGMSHIPLTVDVDVIFGPFHGAWARVFGGWARANSWLMPALTTAQMTAIDFQACDIKGLHGGIELGGSWRRLLKASASWQTAPSSANSGYYLWRDRARHVVNANLTVTPLDKLDIEVTYELRACRSMYTTTIVNDPDKHIVTTSVEKTNLHNISQLNAGARYRFTPQLHFFIRGENLINHRSLLPDAIPAQRMTALVGATYRF